MQFDLGIVCSIPYNDVSLVNTVASGDAGASHGATVLALEEARHRASKVVYSECTPQMDLEIQAEAIEKHQHQSMVIGGC